MTVLVQKMLIKDLVVVKGLMVSLDLADLKIFLVVSSVVEVLEQKVVLLEDVILNKRLHLLLKKLVMG